ncbi:unnamed protein product [Peronospora belbahrii]|uniref:F5/8 type C domain-containing protein n=1 Tax=Peronospora belbahrii TaxID=622444 RepID=A0ABN8D0N9_9STRA|nr:unnamed protein product [Peronospora belbahrii]
MEAGPGILEGIRRYTPAASAITGDMQPDLVEPNVCVRAFISLEKHHQILLRNAYNISHPLSDALGERSPSWTSGTVVDDSWVEFNIGALYSTQKKVPTSSVVVSKKAVA